MRIELSPPRRHRLGLTPLVDVVFLLVVFFMLISTFQDLRSVSLETTSATGGGAMEGTVLVRVLDDGGLDLNGASLGLDQLEAEIRRYLDHNPEQQVLVQPQSTVSLQRLVDVLDRLRRAGVVRLTLTNN